jgi:hypothetical protein
MNQRAYDLLMENFVRKNGAGKNSSVCANCVVALVPHPMAGARSLACINKLSTPIKINLDMTNSN